jgi:hypothetical protein
MTRKTKAEQPAAMFPLFYRQPEALMATVHAGVRLTPETNFRFAAATNAVPIMMTEFVEAQRCYPIVFVGEPVHPATVLGLETDNLFVDGEGRWAQGQYIPAYVRRYPFVFIENVDQSQYALGIDAASERLVAEPEQGIALFEGGQPTRFTEDALRFSAALQADQRSTRAFCEALVEQDLLIDQQAHGALPNGKRFNVQGFRIIDEGKFQALADSVVVEWHRKGWLALAQHHLASLRRWQDLLARQGGAEPAPVAEADVPVAETVDA